MDYEKYPVGKGSKNEIYAKDMQLKSTFKKKKKVRSLNKWKINYA